MMTEFVGMPMTRMINSRESSMDMRGREVCSTVPKSRKPWIGGKSPSISPSPNQRGTRADIIAPGAAAAAALSTYSAVKHLNDASYISSQRVQTCLPNGMVAGVQENSYLGTSSRASPVPGVSREPSRPRATIAGSQTARTWAANAQQAASQPMYPVMPSGIVSGSSYRVPPGGVAGTGRMRSTSPRGPEHPGPSSPVFAATGGLQGVNTNQSISVPLRRPSQPQQYLQQPHPFNATSAAAPSMFPSQSLVTFGPPSQLHAAAPMLQRVVPEGCQTSHWPTQLPVRLGSAAVPPGPSNSASVPAGVVTAERLQSQGTPLLSSRTTVNTVISGLNSSGAAGMPRPTPPGTPLTAARNVTDTPVTRLRSTLLPEPVAVRDLTASTDSISRRASTPATVRGVGVVGTTSVLTNRAQANLAVLAASRGPSIMLQRQASGGITSPLLTTRTVPHGVASETNLHRPEVTSPILTSRSISSLRAPSESNLFSTVSHDLLSTPTLLSAPETAIHSGIVSARSSAPRTPALGTPANEASPVVSPVASRQRRLSAPTSAASTAASTGSFNSPGGPKAQLYLSSYTIQSATGEPSVTFVPAMNQTTQEAMLALQKTTDKAIESLELKTSHEAKHLANGEEDAIIGDLSSQHSGTGSLSPTPENAAVNFESKYLKHALPERKSKSSSRDQVAAAQGQLGRPMSVGDAKRLEQEIAARAEVYARHVSPAVSGRPSSQNGSISGASSIEKMDEEGDEDWASKYLSAERERQAMMAKLVASERQRAEMEARLAQAEQELEERDQQVALLQQGSRSASVCSSVTSPSPSQVGAQESLTPNGVINDPAAILMAKQQQQQQSSFGVFAKVAVHGLGQRKVRS